MAGSYCSATFSFLGNLHTAFWTSHTNLCSPNSIWGVTFSPHSHQHLLFMLFWIMAILIGARGYSTVVFICSSLILNDVELSFCVPIGLQHFLLLKNVYSALLPIS